MNCSVLVVDDDDDDFLLLTLQLNQYQTRISLTQALDGLEATKLLTDGLQPQLLVVDALMPLMDGYELLVWVRNSPVWRQLPVVIWAGDLSQRDITRYYQAGANAIILKKDALGDTDAFFRQWFHLIQLPFYQ